MSWSVLGWSELKLVELEWSGCTWDRVSLGVVGWSELELEWSELGLSKLGWSALR